MTHALGQLGEALIKHFEGFADERADGMVQAYPDPASGGDPWTIGWGSTGGDIHRGTVWTKAQCQARFERDVAGFVTGVNNLIGNHPTTQNQFDALVSFAYNLGTHSLSTATLLNKHLHGNYADAALEFAKWNHAGGHVMAGLTTRRAAEAALYRKQ